MILWANLHLLFWLSLLPFVTSWMDDSHFAPVAVAAYGAVLLLCAIAWGLLRMLLIREHARESPLVTALSRGTKEWVSTILYLVAIGLAFISPWLACGLYALVAAAWFIPDRRIERAMAARGE